MIWSDNSIASIDSTSASNTAEQSIIIKSARYRRHTRKSTARSLVICGYAIRLSPSRYPNRLIYPFSFIGMQESRIIFWVSDGVVKSVPTLTCSSGQETTKGITGVNGSQKTRITFFFFSANSAASLMLAVVFPLPGLPITAIILFCTILPPSLLLIFHYRISCRFQFWVCPFSKVVCAS